MLLVLFALVLRLLYVPSHLALEEHSATGGSPYSHASSGVGHPDEDHHHEEDHPSHPAVDHAGDLIAQRVSHQTQMDLSALLPVERPLVVALRALCTTRETSRRAPDPRPRAALRPRGPPAAA